MILFSHFHFLSSSLCILYLKNHKNNFDQSTNEKEAEEEENKDEKRENDENEMKRRRIDQFISPSIHNLFEKEEKDENQTKVPFTHLKTIIPPLTPNIYDKSSYSSFSSFDQIYLQNKTNYEMLFLKFLKFIFCDLKDLHEVFFDF